MIYYIFIIKARATVNAPQLPLHLDVKIRSLSHVKENNLGLNIRVTLHK